MALTGWLVVKWMAPDQAALHPDGAAPSLSIAIVLSESRGVLPPIIRSLVYIPTIIPIAIALIVWRQIYAPDGGFLNNLLGLVGIPLSFDGIRPSLDRTAPMLGEDNNRVMG